MSRVRRDEAVQQVGWKPLLARCEQLCQDVSNRLYDLAKLLVEINSNQQFQTDMATEGKRSDDFLNEFVGKRCRGFNWIELKEMLRLFPERQQWESMDINEMYVQADEKIRSEQRQRREERRRAARPPEEPQSSEVVGGESEEVATGDRELDEEVQQMMQDGERRGWKEPFFKLKVVCERRAAQLQREKDVEVARLKERVSELEGENKALRAEMKELRKLLKSRLQPV